MAMKYHVMVFWFVAQCSDMVGYKAEITWQTKVNAYTTLCEGKR